MLRLKESNKNDAEYYKDIVAERDEKVREVDELQNWKAVYEAGHGMQAMAKNLNQMKAENKRLNVLAEKLNTEMSMLLDQNNTLSHAFTKLKKDTGKPDDFAYPELALQAEVVDTASNLRSQLEEMERQVSALESENTRLRQAMKAQAGSIGEKVGVWCAYLVLYRDGVR